MKILVTGGAGYIGSVVVEVLLDAGHEVVVIDNLTTGHSEAVDPRARFHPLAVASLPLTTLTGDVVVHLAGSISVAESVKRPGWYYRNNILGAWDAVKATYGAHFIFASTAAVYEPVRWPLAENSPLGPISPYGRSKRAAEDIVRDCATSHTILRFFNAAGATEAHGEDHRPEEHLIPNAIRGALTGAEVTIHGADYHTPDGTAVRDYVHVRDIAEAVRLAAESRVEGTFNLGGGRGRSVQEVLAEVERAMDTRVPCRQGPRRPGDPARLVAGTTMAREVLGWEPANSALSTIVEDAVRWHAAHPNGYAGGQGA